jgi:hypothetical protein
MLMIKQYALELNNMRDFEIVSATWRSQDYVFVKHRICRIIMRVNIYGRVLNSQSYRNFNIKLHTQYHSQYCIFFKHHYNYKKKI